MEAHYDHRRVESEARAKWDALKLYETDLSNTEKEPYYLLVEFPYPSGDLHIGHWYAFAVTDIYARLLRAQGKNVLFPIGFDAFGLPAENAAIKNKLDPREWTMKNIERMRTQLATMGPSFDWSKEVITCDPSYYHWTQWLFAKLFENGLAERREAPVKWCPKDQTVLANEQVVDGCCERCGTPVEEKRLTQWFFKITQYAERLLADLDPLPWREEIKDAQRAWIGKSEGAEIPFELSYTRQPSGALPSSLAIFTTRPGTLFGATFVVVAPEHPWLTDALYDEILENKKEVEEYVLAASRKTERERSENLKKTGVELVGVKATNPATKELLPVYVADYVLGSYGTGAVMGVPAHDERDFAFAQTKNLPLRQVIAPRRVDERNPHQEGKTVVERDQTISVIRNSRTGDYLCLKWKHEPWTTFVTGGIEAGEDPLQSALREVEKETGLTKLTLVAALGQSQSEFYASHKGVNRIARNHVFLFECDDTEAVRVPNDEALKHEAVWLSRKEIEQAGMQHAEFDFIWPRVLAASALPFLSEGILIDSGSFSGRMSGDAAFDIVTAVKGSKKTLYRLRDWLISRQRYWGCPIPIVYDPEGKAHAIPAEHLPWLLPTDVDFTPTGKAPLASSRELAQRVTDLFGEGWTPEFDTLDTFVDSSWYFARYLDATNEQNFSDMQRMQRWLPVNRYSGGAEHTTMHLLYSRFFIKALHDLALVPVDEPYHERFNRGLILGPDGQKMSKSKGNVVNPDEFVQKYGADAVRVYLAFIGPYSEPGNYPWTLEGVASMRKFLDRVARLSTKVTGSGASETHTRLMARVVQKVRDDGDRFKFNTAVATLMAALNELEKGQNLSRVTYRDYLIALAPFAPHLTEHIWDTLGEEGSVHEALWPVYDPALLAEEHVEIVVQVSGKRRGSLMVAPDAEESVVLKEARALPAVVAALAGKEPVRTVYVPRKVLNLVV